jgi:ADP-ribose pyrophosphatase YjhB (NUDIX family)
MTMHYLQKHILDSLREASSRRYAQLNTDEIESGHFRYHLSELIKGGYVAQLERGLYGLTPKGQSYVDKLSEKTVNPSPMPKIITYTLLKDGHELLLLKKSKQPYMGLLNMIGGKLHEGELAVDAAVREVKEKTGVAMVPPTLAGIFEILISTDSGLLTHAVAYVYVANVSKADFKDENIVIVPEKEVLHLDILAPDFPAIFSRICNSQAVQTASFKLHL